MPKPKTSERGKKVDYSIKFLGGGRCPWCGERSSVERSRARYPHKLNCTMLITIPKQK